MQDSKKKRILMYNSVYTTTCYYLPTKSFTERVPTRVKIVKAY